MSFLNRFRKEMGINYIPCTSNQASENKTEVGLFTIVNGWGFGFHKFVA